MKPLVNQNNSKELNAMLSFQQQHQSIVQSPNGLSVSQNNNMFTSNNKILKGTDYQSQQHPALSVTDINNNTSNQQPTTLLGKYDPNKKPPLVQIAQEHQQSVMVGINKKHMAKPELLKSCPCCQRQIEKTQFSLNCELSKMAFLGTGVPLYFHFIKLCLFLAFIHLSSSSIYWIVSNSKGDNCITQVTDATKSTYNQCYNNWITYFSLGNVLNNEADIEIQSILGTISVFLMILGIHYYRGIARKVVIDTEYDVKHVSIADYSIMISGIDSNKIKTNFAESIIYFFENNMQVHLLERMLKVEGIDLCFDVTSSKRLKAQKDILDRKIQAIKSRIIIPDKFQNQLNLLENQVQQINKEIQDFEFHSAQKDLKFYQKYFLGKAFVTFSTIKEKELLLQQTQIPPDYRLWGTRSQVEFIPGDTKIEISQAPHPSEVNWDYLYLNEDQYFKKNTAGLIFMSLISLLFFLVIMIFLLVQYNSLEQDVSDLSQNGSKLTTAMSLCIAFIIPLLNKLLLYIGKAISKQECHPTKQIQQNQTTRNVLKSQIFITCFTTLFIQLIFHKDNFVGRVFNTGGLVHNQLLIILTQSFLLTFFSLFDVDGKLSFWKRREIELCSSHTQINLTQNKLNKLFEQPEMDFIDGYSTTITIICQALFYSILVPFAVVIAFGGLFVKYWVDKYIFVRKRAVINQQNHFLCFLMLDMLEYVVLIYSLGNLIFLFYVQSYFIPYAAIVGVVLSLLNCLLPSDLITQRIFKYERREIVEAPYTVVKEKFPETYHQTNPAFNLFTNSRKTSSNNIRGKKSAGEDFEEINKTGGSRTTIKNKHPQLDDHQNEIHSLTKILNSPDQMKVGRQIDQNTGNILQNSTLKQNINHSLQKQNVEESYMHSPNKSAKSLQMIQSHNIYNNQNKENINKPAFKSQKSVVGGDKLMNHLNQSNSSYQQNERNSQNPSLRHMKSKEFQQMQQKLKVHDESFIEEPDMHPSPIKHKVK